jgi:non-specific serine/threonine protein kinase
MWLDRLEAEHANLRAALSWFTDHGKFTQAQRMAAALGPFWRHRGHVLEARPWLDRVLAHCDDRLASPVRMQALWPAAIIDQQDMRPERAITLAEDGLALSRHWGDEVQTARLMSLLGTLARLRGDQRCARTWFAESRELSRSSCNTIVEAEALTGLGRLEYLEGNLLHARSCWERALPIHLDAGELERAQNAGLP